MFILGLLAPCAVLMLSFCQKESNAFFSSSRLPRRHCSTLGGLTTLHMAKTAKKKKTKKTSTGGGGGGGLKGFGSVSTKTSSQVELDRSKEASAFYDYMESSGAGDNLSRCALGYFPLGEGTGGDNNDDDKLRGVTALKPVKKGDAIIRIPYEMAINLGQEGADPTIPAVELLRDYCETLLSFEQGGKTTMGDSSSSGRICYYRMLPPFRGDDCMGSTDFFSDAALAELQAPLIVEETLKRREKVNQRFQLDISTAEDFPTWIDGSPITEDHLLWATWLITSRVLTVQGSAEEGKSYRLLIPFLDMCNHDRSSSHVLTGRAVPGGELKVMAGCAVKEGDAIDICYGGGMAGNDRFIQDYGFLDSGNDSVAYTMVAQQILGKRRIVEGVGAGRFMSEPDRQKTMEELNRTTIEEDTQLLESSATADPAIAASIRYRLGVKRALSQLSKV